LRPLLPEVVREDAPPSEWLRSITAEGIRRGARRIRIEPWTAGVRVEFHGPLGDAEDLELPRGAYPGLASLLAGLSGIAARGRVVPREGRLILGVEKRRIRATVVAVPGPEGDILTLDLRDERIVPAPAADRALDLCELPRWIDRMVAIGGGLVVLAGPSAEETEVALAAVLDLLGERLPRRIGPGDGPPGRLLEILEGPQDEETLPFAARLDAALARRPDLLVAPGLPDAPALADVLPFARERVVVAALPAADAFQAAERIARAGLLRRIPEGLPVGIVAARLMEQLCAACARPFDLHELLAPWPGHRAPVNGSYFAGQGCRACRESGVARLEPVFEFLPVGTGEPFAADARHRSLSSVARAGRAAAGLSTLFRAALRRAAAGRLDVREPLRLLLHELD
jgi:general secretion pathway protein E